MPEEMQEFAKIKIGLASPEHIMEESYGQVTKPETINYRTLKPEPQSLFCERIFGPTKDWECGCGNYKSIRFKGVVCDRCKVEVTHSKVRRERMGHIELVTPVTHIWHFKGSPSTISMLLNIKVKDLEKVIYYQNYIVTDVSGSAEETLKIGDLLDETEYREAVEKYEDSFTARMGGEAIKELLSRIQVTNLRKELRDELSKTKSKQKIKKILRRLEVVNAFANSDNRPEWVVLDVVPVIPPDLRPMVQLEGGRFATSDINDLYRRIINRNNRLKKLQDLNAPEIIIRNEKRMLQEAVDALMDNGRHGRVVKGSGNRPLKSLSDLIKGKQGRFRQNLLGKRVDYSGRSVIVIGPNLKLSQCGLPKLMALELFKPFIMNKLLEKKIVLNIKSAKKKVENKDPEVWDVLEEVVEDHPVLLNRAPTLHRLGIQAFMPVLVEGKAIRLHPLVCAAFNADFDGDQMAVHVPLSQIAKAEAKLLMLSTNNILSPANGDSLVTPTQDMILGLYYLSRPPYKKLEDKDIKRFSCYEEVILAYEQKFVEVTDEIYVKKEPDEKPFKTTVGRVLLNDNLPEEIEFINDVVSKKNLAKLIVESYYTKGTYITVKFLDALKKTGFSYSTKMGCTIGLGNLIEVREKKEILDIAQEQADKVKKQYMRGQISDRERYNKIVSIWSDVVDKIKKKTMQELSSQKNLNSLFVMAESGARGSVEQISQLIGMRGLMAKPSGEIIELPIKANFKEGLTVLEYFISTHGARKGLADTALKTANAGYLTRRLIDVSQEVVVNEEDCETINGITVAALKSAESEKVLKYLHERIEGRVSLEEVRHPGTGELIVKANELITKEAALEVENAGIERVDIRSVLTCEASNGICAKCYGRNLATGQMVEIGEAVGIIAAQSIGEPGTQLTMRTFHMGGIAMGGGTNDIKLGYPLIVETIPENIIKLDNDLIVYRDDFLIVRKILESVRIKGDMKQAQPDGFWVNRGDVIAHNKDKTEVIKAPAVGILRSISANKEKELYIIGEDYKLPIPIGSKLKVTEGAVLKANTLIAEADPFNEPILAEISGKVVYEDIVADRTVKEEHDVTGLFRRKIIEDREKQLHPTVIIKNTKSGETQSIDLPYECYLHVEENESVKAGTIIAKIPTESSKTKDITGGLPRVEELFEARAKKKGHAVITQIDGEVHLPEKKKGASTRIIEVRNPNGEVEKYVVPVGRHLKVHEGDQVNAADQLIDGQVNPHDILRVKGEKELCHFMVREIQEVYCNQNVNINDKHIEVIIKQMLRKVEVTDPGETSLLLKDNVSKHQLYEENERVINLGAKPAKAKPVLLGVTRSSMETDSFISAASFQETRQALTNASTAGKVDDLKGLKENVVIGHLITAGTGLKKYRILKDDKEVFAAIEKKKVPDMETV